MKLEDQVVSLDLAKQLKKLGVEQESLYSWSNYSLIGWRLELIPPKGIEVIMTGGTKGEVVAAFTVAELGGMLPNSRGACDLLQYKLGTGYYLEWSDVVEGSPHLLNQEWSASEADARAKMLCYLLDNKLITLPAVS